MLSLALAAVLGHQQSNITFKSNFEPLGKVIERLSSETHIPMAAFGDLKGYPVYVNVKDVPVKELLNRLGAISGGEWEIKDNNYYLIAPQTLRHEQEKAGDPELVSAIDATINQPAPKKKSEAEMMAMMTGAEKDPQKAMKMVGEMMGQMFQADEGTMDLLRVIGPKDLSSIVEGRRVVLSSNPTSMQVLMPSKAINAIKAYLKKLAAEQIKTKKPDAAQGFDITMMFGGGQGLKNPELVGQIQTIQTVFQITQRSSLNVEMSAFTSDGKGIYKRTVQIPFLNPRAQRPRVQGQTKLDVAQIAKDYAQALEDGKKIDPFMSMIVSAQSGLAGAMTMVLSEDGPFGSHSTQVVPKAISPDMLGPLLDVEAAKGKNIVALPSDAVIPILAEELIRSNGTVEGVLDSIDRSMSERITQDGSWEVMQATSPLELRSAFCKRDALANLIKSGLSKGYVNLDDCSKFATAQDTARGSEILALPLITAVFHTSDMGSATALTSMGFDSLKLYATLSDFQKQALAAKRSVSLASLNPAQTSIIARMVYNGSMPPMKSNDDMAKMFAGDESDGDSGNGMGEMMGLGMAMAGPMMAMMGMGEVTMDAERTILLPDGIPVVGDIRLKTISMDGILATDKSTGNSMITMPEMIAMMSGGIPGIQMPKRDFNEYKLAKQTSYLLHFQLGKGASYFVSLYDVWVDQSKTYTKEQLPEKIQERMKMPDFQKAGPADGTATPPPPVVIPPRN